MELSLPWKDLGSITIVFVGLLVFSAVFVFVAVVVTKAIFGSGTVEN